MYSMMKKLALLTIALFLTPLMALEPCATLVYVTNQGEILFSPEYTWDISAESVRFTTLNPEQVLEFNSLGKSIHIITKETTNNRNLDLTGRLLVKELNGEREIDFTLLPENNVNYDCGGDEWIVELVDKTLEVAGKKISGEFVHVKSNKDRAFGFDDVDSTSEFYVKTSDSTTPIYYLSNDVYRLVENNNIKYLGCCDSSSCVETEKGCRGTVVNAEKQCVGNAVYDYRCSLDSCVPEITNCPLCVNGACTEEIVEQVETSSCVDSDNGIRPFHKGVVEGNEDSCDGPDVIEWYCEAGIAKNTRIQCEHDCVDGACTELPSCIQGMEAVLYDNEKYNNYCSLEGLVEYSCENNVLHSKVTPCNCIENKCVVEEKKESSLPLLPAIMIIAIIAVTLLILPKYLKKHKHTKHGGGHKHKKK